MSGKNEFIYKLSQALKGDLPGPESQYRMAPALRLENSHDIYRNAAVMIMLYQKDGEWHLVLMRRPEYEGVHSNQVSLPGGIREDIDTDLGETALRETREELGIDDSSVQLLGKLSKLEIPVSGIEVTPFIGVHHEIPVFNPDTSEVAYLIEVPIANLVLPANIRQEHRTILCKLVKVPYYQIGKEQVWGATAMILSEFLDLVRSLKEVDLQ